MDKEKAIDIISDAYSPLSMECKLDFLDEIKILDLKKDTILVKEGQYSDKTFFIINGCARAYYLKDGKDISDWFAFENEFISSINSFFLNIPSPCFIELLEDSILLEMSRDSAERLSAKYHEFETLSKVIVISTMLKQQERIVSMQFHSAEEKYDNMISIRPTITQRVPLTHIASYIGMRLETLSRIRNTKSRI